MTTTTAKRTKAAMHRKPGKRHKLAATTKARGVVAEVRQRLGLTRKVFSRLTGFSERAIANWESGGKPDEPGLRRIRETERFSNRLAEVVDPHAIPEWIDTPNEAFAGLKPLEIIERGEIDRLWSMIFYLESGAAS